MLFRMCALIYVLAVGSPTIGQTLDFTNAKRYIAQIGWVELGKFRPDGTGLSTYILEDDQIRMCILTAGHVVDDFLETNRDSFYIRYSWADSIKTTEYFGMAVPRKYKGLTAFYRSPDPNVDLACIILVSKDSTTQKYLDQTSNGHFIPYPLRFVKEPNVGDQTLMLGYPVNIESLLDTFNYSVCTVKPGIVSWSTKTQIDPTLQSY